jgi:5,10-methenyltetrahydromethanopterin hydrogenase
VASNAGKRLDRLEKLLDSIATKNKQHHFVIIQPGETTDQRLAELDAAGIISPGDDIQTVEIPWTVNQLKGQSYIPEGSMDDPLADPLIRQGRVAEGNEYEYGVGIRDNASNPSPDLPPAERLEAWRRHERDIELSGQRYQGPELAKR